MDASLLNASCSEQILRRAYEFFDGPNLFSTAKQSEFQFACILHGIWMSTSSTFDSWRTSTQLHVREKSFAASRLACASRAVLPSIPIHEAYAAETLG